ncbi:MAG: adenylate/guanylate cyclase domain-containing protein [Chitinophagaceae bacterium]|nr:GAF domain-containing protein [Chitinophagaceae bacterium]
MAKLSLKNIVGKNAPFYTVVTQLMEQLQTSARIENEKGKWIAGTEEVDAAFSHSIKIDDQEIGSVKGDEKTAVIAELLQQLVDKENEKKNLGKEVLNLYQEINVIFNFTETLTQTIDPDVIAQHTLKQAIHSVASNSGILILWDEEKKQLEIPASFGEALFNREKVQKNISLLLKIGLSGQSEIINDISILKKAGIIHEEAQSIIYAAMKVKHRIMGAIILAGKQTDQFSAGHLKLLVTLALQSSAAIESAMLYEKNIREAKEREEAMLRIHEVTKKFVPNEFIRSLGKNELTDVRLGDQAEKIVTVLFTDIRDFTTLSEKMSPEENFRFVSSFNAKLGPIIRSHHGFINQYLGDSIMAIFPNDAADALHAAIEMQQAVWKLNKERIKENKLPIRAGIGMHTGPLIMGITGDEQRLDAATISDTVNTAARIESLTKYYKAPLLLSSETLAAINRQFTFHIRNLGNVRLKGKHKLLTILECFDGNEPTEFDNKQQTLANFNTALQNYNEQKFEDAIQAFQSVLDIHPTDETALHFLHKTQKLLEEGIPANWTGAEEMLSK